MRTFCMPRLGDTVKEGIVLAWRKQLGETVQEGELLLEVTADKATLLLESPFSGIVRHFSARPGDAVPADGILALIGEAEEPIPEDLLSVHYPRALPDACLRFRPSLDSPLGQGPVRPLSPMRTVVARRMAQSKAAAPHFYLRSIVDMTSCVALRKRLKEEGLRISYNDMILKASGLALRQYPQVAAAYTEAGYVVRDRMHVGFAVAVEPDGLVVPVIRDADRLSLAEVSRCARLLSEKTRNGRLVPDDYTGGVFTVSNLGAWEVEDFTAIINPGESAILAVGKVEEKPAAVRGEILLRPLLSLTLSSDHRVIDGVLAARFNTALKTLLESAESLA
ncbi:MAG: dihydrolipoamide acetyltransferase family protein [Planctomycetota bacterium]